MTTEKMCREIFRQADEDGSLAANIVAVMEAILMVAGTVDSHGNEIADLLQKIGPSLEMPTS